ncbi:30S ribosome-binding factor RbfA [Desulfonatronospira sp.]|uniref:30S ribosome-binding factor RbfA n=1 Tax=Desulfonatronospira sp. TaxID=1962951 RepID=UPI0025B841C0|nr:30S ribosome-binding factor RbfA [Desulfonatronospira sp.]
MQPATSRRATRMADSIMRELGRIIVLEAQDPRLHLVTITGVLMNKDLSIARVMYTHIHGPSPELEKALHSARGFLRSTLGQNLKMRYVPELRFEWDVYLQEMVYDSSAR